MSVVNNVFKGIEGNYAKGNLGEVSVQDAFRKLGYSVQVHKVSDKGVDLLALHDNSVSIGEVLNWSCKGYIHNLRFMSIVRSLKSISAADSLKSCLAARRYLFCFGVSPTFNQRRLLHAYNIELVHFKDSIKKVTKSIINKIASAVESVITLNSVSIVKAAFIAIAAVFCCNCEAASYFEWWRRLWKHNFVRNFMFNGGFVSGKKWMSEDEFRHSMSHFKSLHEWRFCR